MKKSLILWLLLAGLGVCSLPGAFALADSGKERIVIREEVLSGDPAKAAGIVLRIPCHWGRRLLWNTEYVVGAGTESSFTFSTGQVFWRAPEVKCEAYLTIQETGTLSFGPGITSLGWEYGGSYAIVNSVAERTGNGEKRTETVRFADYSAAYPLDFSLSSGFSVQYEGDYMQARDYLSGFFHIRAAEEEKAEVTVIKNDRGEIEEAGFLWADSHEDIEIVSAAADGEQGIYFAYGLRNGETGEILDRGQNRGIFRFPCGEEERGFRSMDLMQVEKLQDIPDDVLPLEMLLDKERKRLFLAVQDREGFSLLVYRLEGELPVLSDKIPAKSGGGALCRMEAEDGGVLLTFDDNSFSFVAEEGGRYREWCRGVFPQSESFPEEHGCFFDGERLILAAYEDWHSLNVLLAVYDGEGLAYSGRYVHSGNENRDAETDPACRLLPQGYREGRPEDLWDVWEWGKWRYYADEAVEPLEIFPLTEQSAEGF